jgi:hypothetical protein
MDIFCGHDFGDHRKHPSYLRRAIKKITRKTPQTPQRSPIQQLTGAGFLKPPRETPHT